MHTCASCGAAAPATAAWCGQCYTRFPAVATLVSEPHESVPPSVSLTPAAATPRVPRRAVIIALAAIAIGGVTQLIGTRLANDPHLSAATDIRYAMVLTMALYAVVGVLVVSQLTRDVRLRWSDGQPALGIAIGLLVGGGLSVTLLAIVSSAAGHLDPDPRAVLLMSEGDAPHIIATILITCVAAPLVEELVFRGFLLESLRRRGRALAIWASALAFAVWHFTPSALRYYALLGALLGLLYSKRGLACSIAAHVGFNGVLTIAALSIVLSPGPTVDAAGLSLHLPGGWRQSQVLPQAFGPVVPVATFDGPSGATLAVATLQTPIAGDMQAIVDRIDTVTGDQSLTGRSMREVALPVGRVLQMQIDVDGHAGTVVLIPHNDGELYELELHSAGSVRASVDFQRMLQGLSLQR